MKIITSIALIVLIFYCNTNAQDSDRVFMPKNTMLKKGNWAIIFEMGTIWGGSSSSFEAYSLTAKKHITDNLALRLSCGFNINQGSGNGNKSSLYGDYTNYENDFHYYHFQSSFNLQYYILKNEVTKFFFSIGPYGDYSNSKRYSFDSTSYEDWSMGVFGSIGTEIFLFKNLSLIGEYIMKATTGKSIQKTDMSGYHQYDDNKISHITFNTMRIGLSVYF